MYVNYVPKKFWYDFVRCWTAFKVDNSTITAIRKGRGRTKLARRNEIGRL